MHLPATGDPAILTLPVTQTFYSIAAGLSLSLCLVLLIFARFQPDTRVIRSWGLALTLLSIAFFVSGIRSMLPEWATVIGTNTLLLAAGPLLFTCFSSYCQERPPQTDWPGWVIVALAIPAFWYWGLVKPDGISRSMTFSLALAAINGRTALLLARSALRPSGSTPVRALAVLFTALTVWMSARFVLLLLANPVAPELRAANPTGWLSVFGYIVIVSLMSVCVMWMEVNRLKERLTGGMYTGSLPAFFEYFRNKLLLLWSAVMVLIVGVVSMLGIGYVNIRETEQAQLIRSAELVNDAFVEHTIQVANHVDSILCAVRGYYLRTGSIAETGAFIRAVGFDRTTVDNIFLIDPDGIIIISPEPEWVGRSVADREYLHFHRATSTDQIFIAPVETGRVTGKNHFRIMRRIDKPDGSFGGLVLATVKPESFTRYYSDLTTGSQWAASLLGIQDRKLRARVPSPPEDQWPQPVDSPLWQALEQAPVGRYENTSQVDQVQRHYVFKKVDPLPLVAVTGFSDTDLQHIVGERMRWLVFSSLALLACTVLLALLFTNEAKRRDEQKRFMSMLSHELKTPLSIMRLALDAESIQPGVRKHAQGAVTDMSALIDRCLQADRLNHGRFAHRREPILLEPLLAELHTDCMAPERLVLEAAGVPACTSDPQIVRIILNNLIDNAFKYGAADKAIAIAATAAERHGRSGIAIRITNGIGPAGKPDAGQVFEKYYRAAAAHTKTGSGLGLYLAFNLARLIDAELRYLPEDTEITFAFWIPLA